MTTISHLACLCCVLQSVIWPVKGTYYIKPTGRYEISEIPLPSSVIEQLEQNNRYSPVLGPVTPTGVMMQTAPTIHIQVPKPVSCPPPATCPCPCPQPSQTGNLASSLRPLPRNDNETKNCPSLCICVCIDVILSKIKFPNVSGGQIPVFTSSKSGLVEPSFSSVTSPSQFKGTVVPSAQAAAGVTPKIQRPSSSSTVSYIAQKSPSYLSCTGIGGTNFCSS